MKLSKPIILLLPQLLIERLDIFLDDHPFNFSYNREYFYYVLHYIIVKRSYRHDQDYISLNIKKLKLETASNIGRYVKILRNGEFIIDDDNYQKGTKSLHFKINPELFSEDVVSIEVRPNSRLFKRLKAELHKRKAHANRMPLHLRTMLIELKRLELDYTGAYEWIEDNATPEQKTHYMQSIKNIEDSRFRYFKRNKTNKRLDTNLTNMKSDLRQFIKGDFVSIDLKNSQPYLLSILLKNINHKGYSLCCHLQEVVLIKTFGKKRLQKVVKTHQNLKKPEMVSLRLFSESVREGNLYETFIESYMRPIERAEAKDIMLKVFFSQNITEKKFIPYLEDKKKFASVFPIAYRSVYALKEGVHSLLPIYLQRLESYLFIDCIAKELVEEGIVPLTIHDSVIVKKIDSEKALEIVKNVFKRELGLIPSFHVESLKPKVEVLTEIEH